MRVNAMRRIKRRTGGKYHWLGEGTSWGVIACERVLGYDPLPPSAALPLEGGAADQPMG
jgi:hypothetical protein